MRHKDRELEIQRKNKRERQKERVITRGRGQKGKRRPGQCPPSFAGNGTNNMGKKRNERAQRSRKGNSAGTSHN